MDDTIYRQETIKHLKHRLYETAMNNPDLAGVFSEMADHRVETWINELPSAQSEVIRCKDCKHFHYDMPYVIQGIPVLGHEVCDFWGDGCKTSENGFCSFAEE